MCSTPGSAAPSGLTVHLGWPDPATAELEPGQPSLAGCLEQYYPGSCLVTGRDIITLWVARMVLTGLYNLGDVPFTDVFLHANIMDGNGVRMSKSKGNGIDPVDIIGRYGTDAMRYILCDMQTGLQDIRLPVQVESPFTGNIIDLHKAKHGQTMFTYICPESGKEFDVLGTMKDIPSAQPFSMRFEEGQKFCNKLWNASRFALQNLEDTTFTPRTLADLAPEDRWILSRLSRCIESVGRELDVYNPSAAISAIREFFWGELCDWYIEIVKPRMWEGDAAAKQVLAACFDHALRILHPFVPFITEELWSRLGELAPRRGITIAFDPSALVCLSAWPDAPDDWRDGTLEADIEFVQGIITGIREIRNRCGLPDRQEVEARIRAEGVTADKFGPYRDMIQQMAVLSVLQVGADVERTIDSAASVVRDVEIFIPGAIDLEKEKARLEQQVEKLTARLKQAEKKLANENFVQRAQTGNCREGACYRRRYSGAD